MQTVAPHHFAPIGQSMSASIGWEEIDAMRVSEHIISTPNRRRFLQSAGVLGGMAATFPVWADTYIDLDLPGGPNRRELTTAFPQRGQMILQRTRPPLLETPFEIAAPSPRMTNFSCAGIGR